ncbi:TRAP transporter substrate-binding protein DctP [Cellulosilyticum sp. I15G10I2]|uniref:TRAP transporter substrate-binding protein DctP n=1 Tax=Cellulosilyticum sp. I15G10I2 TaxID=1892843 RepID=UPI00085CA0B3|nr:TRAP transporter substrate-binding protein DctP [Cellulosilyticum sp. I15G10I2]
MFKKPLGIVFGILLVFLLAVGCTSTQPTDSGTNLPKEVISTNQPKDATDAGQPQNAAGTDQPKEVTDTNQPKDATGANQPKDASGTSQPKDAMGANQPKDASGTNQPKDTTGANQPKDATSTTQRKDVIELKLAHPNLSNSELGKEIKAWADAMEQKSDGRLKITVYANQTLVEGLDTYSAVVDGLADIGWNTCAQTPEIHQLTQLTTLPMLAVPNVFEGAQAIDYLYNEYNSLKNEFNDVHLFALQVSGGGAAIGTNNKPIKTLDDLDGMRLSVPAGANTDFMELAGVQAVNVPDTEIRKSMENNILDGYLLSLTSISDLQLWDATRYITQVYTYAPVYWLAMNEARYESLPADLKRVVDDCSEEAARNINSAMEKLVNNTIKKAKVDLKHNYYLLPARESARWKTVAQQAWDVWFAAMSKNNLPAREATDRFERLILKFDDHFFF